MLGDQSVGYMWEQTCIFPRNIANRNHLILSDLINMSVHLFKKFK